MKHDRRGLFGQFSRVHMVGIGGIGMCGIAEVLLMHGLEVTGSDLADGPALARLAANGARIAVGHVAGHVGEAQVVVFSSAVRPDNPELEEARRRGIPIIPRAEMLAGLMRAHYGIAVAGSHGKTSTTSMVSSVLTRAELDPTIVVGGILTDGGVNARVGRGRYFVAEADESDGTFNLLDPVIAVVTNIDREHLDHYAGISAIRRAFQQFLSKVPFYGLAILCADDSHAMAVRSSCHRRTWTYGIDSREAHIQATDVRSEGTGMAYLARAFGEDLGPVRIRVPGRHMVANSLAALAVGLELGVPFESIAASLAEYAGVRRRAEIKGEAAGVLVIDDYGHHPTEIRATLAALRQAYPGRRLVVAFQPHRYTRTRFLMEEFARAFGDADVLVVSAIYPASETPIEGVTSEALVERIRQAGHPSVAGAPEESEVLECLLAECRSGDLVVTLGAGRMYRVGEELLRTLADGGDQGP